VDFSGASAHAVRHALALARETRGPLILMHVLDAPLLEDPRALLHFNMPSYRSFLEVEAREQLLALAPEEDRRGLAGEDVVCIGKPWREILRVVDERAVSCVVMGVRGRGALDLMLFGSTTQHVVREARCPVLTVAAGVAKPAAAAEVGVHA
jgi:nucleotide-binding universal stress UspA family protein